MQTRLASPKRKLASAAPDVFGGPDGNGAAGLKVDGFENGGGGGGGVSGLITGD
ncbi:MAG: hypothetical protein ACKV19_02010 [Verrucomicrobiales bacterium]